MRNTLFLLLFCLIPGCGYSPAAPDRALPVSFRLGVFRVAALAPFFAEGADGSVSVGGTFKAPCSPYEATAQATQDGSALLLRVIGENQGDCPQDVAASLLYDAEIRGISPGHYRIRVVHEWKDVSWPATLVFQGSVVVR